MWWCPPAERHVRPTPVACGFVLHGMPLALLYVRGRHAYSPTAARPATGGKLLSCGVHACHERCHTGPCPQTCRETVVRSCECGKTQRTMQARGSSALLWVGNTANGLCCWLDHDSSDRSGMAIAQFEGSLAHSFSPTPTALQCQEGAFRCERRCTSTRSCGRHPCRRRCCDGVSCPPCEEVCGRWLKCRNHRCVQRGRAAAAAGRKTVWAVVGKHAWHCTLSLEATPCCCRCPAPCHSGECAPCPLSARISCACGKTSYRCGMLFV